MGIDVRLNSDTQARVIDSLVLCGDISALSPQERARYYIEFCNALGLNAASKPLEILRLNGKEVLYPTRGATDQLAAMHRLNREIIDGPKLIDLAGTKLVYCVCRATHPNGRVETAVATVALSDPANVLMKCETKAKRRATLSILGLGLLDETEVEAIPASAKSPAEPIVLEHAQLEDSAEEHAHAKEEPEAVVRFLDELQQLTSPDLWNCAAVWVRSEAGLRQVVDSETLHELQLKAKGHAPDATSMDAWKWACECLVAQESSSWVAESVKVFLEAKEPTEFVISWKAKAEFVKGIADQYAKLCWQLHWRGYCKLFGLRPSQDAFKRALTEPQPPEGNGKGSKKSSSASAQASAEQAAPAEGNVSSLVPLIESKRYANDAEEWKNHCARYKHREHALNSWAKHFDTFRAAGEQVYRARLHVAAERLQALVNAADVEVCKVAFLNMERIAQANARKHAAKKAVGQ